MDKIFIKNMIVNGIIGINDAERISPQKIIVNIELGCDTRSSSTSDNISDTLNYYNLSMKIIEFIKETKPYLVETLANNIAKICIEYGAEYALIRVDKPEAVEFAETVGVEIKRDKNDFKS